MKPPRLTTLVAAATLATAGSLLAQPDPPKFQEVTVHDPMVVRDGDMFYVFGSHLATAKSRNLMAWEKIADGVRDGNPLIPNVTREMREALEWSQTKTFWAGCVAQLRDGRFYFYYSTCKGDSPRAALGLAVADHVEGPYRHQAILLRSGMWNQPSEDGTVYDATIHPNAIDPHVFYDHSGKLWMVYGSYSGGIFILAMDETSGRPIDGQGYGKKLLGGNHSRIEAPYILFNPQTKYYYLFLSFGGLDSRGGYNIRVARSRNPDGPYVDRQGNEMINAHGPAGSFFDDAAIEPYGAKLIGSFQWLEGEEGKANGYVSPGHNSACYDPGRDKYFIFFHTRFPGTGEMHQVRVHQLLFNARGWPVIAPHRYAGERLDRHTSEAIPGEYQFINHGRKISPEIIEAQRIRLETGGEISGAVRGSWKRTGDNEITLTIDGTEYSGVLLRQWDQSRGHTTLTFSALSDKGIAIWGSAIKR